MYASPNIIRVIKSRRMRWAGHVASMEKMKNTYNILIGKYHLEDLGVDGNIIVVWEVVDWIYIWIWIGTSGRLL
jgi:hypothetical protein